MTAQNSPAPETPDAPKPVNAIPPDRVVILFLIMLVAAAGNTAMQSTLPAIASQLKIADVWVSLAFSWSALLWVITAPKWARMSDQRGRKVLMRVGMFGFILSMALCGMILWMGMHAIVSPMITFIVFAIFRSLYGGFGSAAPPAVQAYVAARTERAERTKALSWLASSFGLGTVIGPAIAHFLVFEPLGLAGPLIMFAVFGLLVAVALQVRLPNDTPRFAARGSVAAYPSAASMAQPDYDESDQQPAADVRLKWRDPRMWNWLLAGLIGGHAQAIILGLVGFLVRDRLGLVGQPGAAVQAIGSVMFIGAMATLLAQWGLIPMLSMAPRTLVLSGSVLAIVGVIITGITHDFYGISMGFAIASLGFGLFRPGFNAGASLAVRRHEQGDVAGKIASVNGAAYIFAPALGVALYNIWEPGTFILIAAALAYLILWGSRALADTEQQF
jgi:predicted MFS family arabinose efflux permease